MTSHSSTQRFNTCPFAYSLHKEGLTKITTGAESNFAVWGKAMHSGLEAHYRLGASASEYFLDAYPEDLDPQNQVWTREGGVRTLDSYSTYYREIDRQWEVLEVELADPPAPERPTLVIDLVARHRQTGSVYLFDHKFKAKMPWGAERRYELDAQLTRYISFVRQKWGDCAGAVVNTIVPGFRQRAYKGEPAGWHCKFERLVVQRTPQQIDFWERSQAEWEGLIRHCEKSSLYPKHLGWQCSSCEYFELCCSGDDPEVRESLYTLEPVGQQFEVVVEDELA